AVPIKMGLRPRVTGRACHCATAIAWVSRVWRHTPRQLYQQGFAALSPDQQDRILRDIKQGIPDTFDGSSIQSAVRPPARAARGAASPPTPTWAGVAAAQRVHAPNRDYVLYAVLLAAATALA